ncbi:PHB protein, partial [Regulus satrapa]|nr:PHB protein [Regulus satrapa]
DLQNVNITLRILFRPVTAQLPRIFTSIGEDYDERVLPSITTEILKSVVVSAPRALPAGRGRRAGSLEFQPAPGGEGLGAPPVLSLPGLQTQPGPWALPGLSQGGVPAAHLAGAAWGCAEQQKKAAVISAEGDSKAAELIANSLATAGDGLIELRKLEAAEDIAYQLSRSRNITYLPSGQSVLLQLPQ